MISNPDTMKLCVGIGIHSELVIDAAAPDHGQPDAARRRRPGGDRLPRMELISRSPRGGVTADGSPTSPPLTSPPPEAFPGMRRYVLTITCPDRIGIVATVTGFIAGHGGSVLEAAQHGDLSSGLFFLRIEVTAESLPFGPDEFRGLFEPVAAAFSMEWQIADTDVHKRVLLLVSREDHCLADLLYRWRSGDMECDITSVVSNHDDLRSLVEWHGIPFHAIPVPSEPTSKTAAFEEIQRIFEGECADVMVLARYMQILPASLCGALSGRIINIHHSFLPSFAGSRPYHQAFAVWRQADRRHLSLRHGRPRRGSHH